MDGLGPVLTIVMIVAALIAASMARRAYRTKKRRRYLFAKYNDDVIVDRIMSGTIWQGMSDEQLIDSWGSPAARDNKVYKTKTAQTFKYHQTGRNRFGSRVKVENGIVVGWEQK